MELFYLKDIILEVMSSEGVMYNVINRTVSYI